MSYGIGPSCDGCGACVPACPRGAIALNTTGPIPYAVAPLDCNDCGKCAIVCPRRAITPEPGWAECMGRGCPLTGSRRYDGWSCSEGRWRCHACGNALWKPPGRDRRWMCVRCDAGTRVMCPKVRRATVLDHAASRAPG